MRGVASALGLTPMALYHYFPNRAALLNEAISGEFEVLAQMGERRRKGAESSAAMDLLIDAMEAYLDYALERPKLFNFVFVSEREGARKFPEGLSPGASASFDALYSGISRAIQSGAIAGEDPMSVCIGAIALAHGLIGLHLGDRLSGGEDELRQLFRASLRRYLNGCS